MRKLTEDELSVFSNNLNGQVATILNVAQVKTILRLMKDEVGEDKDLLEYVNLALNQQILKALKICIPIPEAPPNKTIWIMAETSDDWLFKYLATKDDWVYEHRTAQTTMRMSECSVVDRAKNPAELGTEFDCGIRGRGLWLFLRSQKGAWQIYCSTCSWNMINPNHISFVCQKCNNVLLRCVENEPNNLC